MYTRNQRIDQCVTEVYESMKKHGYDPVNQFIGYFISGDPTYITAKEGARSKVTRLDRLDILEEMVRYYVTETLMIEQSQTAKEDTKEFCRLVL